MTVAGEELVQWLVPWRTKYGLDFLEYMNILNVLARQEIYNQFVLRYHTSG